MRSLCRRRAVSSTSLLCRDPSSEHAPPMAGPVRPPLHGRRAAAATTRRAAAPPEQRASPPAGFHVPDPRSDATRGDVGRVLRRQVGVGSAFHLRASGARLQRVRSRQRISRCVGSRGHAHRTPNAAHPSRPPALDPRGRQRETLTHHESVSNTPPPQDATSRSGSASTPRGAGPASSSLYV